MILKIQETKVMIFMVSFVFLIIIIILINKRKGEPDFLSDNINEEMPI